LRRPLGPVVEALGHAARIRGQRVRRAQVDAAGAALGDDRRPGEANAPAFAGHYPALRVMTPRSRLGGEAGLLDEPAPLRGILLQQLAQFARRRSLDLEPELLRELDALAVAEHGPERIRGALHRLGARLRRHEEGVPLAERHLHAL